MSDSRFDHISLGALVLLIDAQDTSTTSEALVSTAVVHFFDAHLTQCRRAHNAGLDSHIEYRPCERILRGLGCELLVSQYLVDCFELRMSGSLNFKGSSSVGSGNITAEPDIHFAARSFCCELLR